MSTAFKTAILLLVAAEVVYTLVAKAKGHGI